MCFARSSAAAALIATLAFSTPRAAAQSCQGDCNGDGRVVIGEIVLAVNIAQGLLSLAECPVLGPLPVGIDRIIASVSNALCDCRPCPTPPPTRTATVTPTATPIPTVTQTPTVQTQTSVWREDNARLGSSTCAADINNAVRDALSDVNCFYTVVRRGSQVSLEDCEGYTLDGTIDDRSVVTATTTISESAGPCFFELTFDLTVDLSRSPTTANYGVAVDFTGCPGLRDCRLNATTRWTRQSGAAAVRRAAGGGVIDGFRSALSP